MNSRTMFAAAAALALGTSVVGSGALARDAAPTAAIETVVPTDFQTTWDTLVADLDDGDFKINATIRENSTIRVLLQSETPSTWVDCGSIAVNSKHKVFGDRTYEFPAANSVRYLVANEQVDELVDVERRTTLNALATIKLAPTRDGTSVKVDAHYVMKFRTREFGRNFTPRKLDTAMDFDSAGHANATEQIRQGAAMKAVALECRPTGELEKRIVSVLGNPHTLMAAKDDGRPPDPPPAAAAAPTKPTARPAVVPIPVSKPLVPPAPSVAKILRPTPAPPPIIVPPAKDAPMIAANDGWRIQLSALSSQAAAEKAWNRLKPANPDLLAVLTPHVQKVDLAKGTFFRLQAGPLADRPAAASLCTRLKKRNQDCLIVAP